MSSDPGSLQKRLAAIAQRKQDAKLTTYGKFSDEDLIALQKALESDPDNHQIREMAAFSFYSSDRSEEAAAIYEDLLRTHPGNFSYHYYLANSYAKLGDSERAIQNWEIVVDGTEAGIAKKARARIDEMRKAQASK